ncbi:MAG: hypothetical protein H7301_12635 [Cryobacterium sp.]|nr:hypothetical protein [Oligoflexia bacterium]
MNMTTSATISPRPRSMGIFFGLFSGGIALFAANLFLLEPFMSKAVNPAFAGTIYTVVRILGLVFLGYALTRYAGRNRFQVISTVLLIGFIDQVFLKGLWVSRDTHLHPENWVGIDPSNAAIFVNMAMGFLFFIPIVLILSLLGIEATRFHREWTRSPSN